MLLQKTVNNLNMRQRNQINPPQKKNVTSDSLGNDEKILEVNNEYLGHDYYTDVITFDYDEDDVINGDIVISLDTVRTNAEQFGKTYDDELHRVIIHGILHLCGINDKGPGEREIMEENENKALALLEGASILKK